MKRFALGALLMYFLDPQSGRRRRSLLGERLSGFVRRFGRGSQEQIQGIASEPTGPTQGVEQPHGEEEPQRDDATLAHKVESEIFRNREFPKGQININAQEGVVVLRGQVERPELIKDLEERTRKVQGVRDVENLLHLPDTPAPMHQ